MKILLISFSQTDYHVFKHKHLIKLNFQILEKMLCIGKRLMNTLITGTEF